MPWLVGIDEAGYGPNLGPLVVGSVAVRVPDKSPPLHELLRPIVRRAADPNDGRLLIDDSKKVNVGTDGLAKLERGVLTICAAQIKPRGCTLGDVIAQLGTNSSAADLASEPWFVPGDPVPVATVQRDNAMWSRRMAKACKLAGMVWGTVRAAIIQARRFNELLERWENKSAVELDTVIGLLREARELPGDDPICIAVDRLGGRTYYSAMLQTAFPDGWVQTLEETAGCCRYTLLGLERSISVSFQPKAESEHLTVAAASMTCKYLREVCMAQFNRFWQRHVPGLQPTAGYPGDARRFYSSIEPAMRTLNISSDRVWRKK